MKKNTLENLQKNKYYIKPKKINIKNQKKIYFPKLVI